MITMYVALCSKGRPSDLKDALRHLKHIVASLKISFTNNHSIRYTDLIKMGGTFSEGECVANTNRKQSHAGN